jgi:ATP-dependent exoDNAse (exonuclease V) beta subunit
MRDLDLNDPGVLSGSLVVSASAGSGKTYTLTVLVTATLGQGEVRPFEILATTFSEAATADLRERLLRPLDLLASLDEAAWAELLPLSGEAAALEALTAAAPEGRLRRACAETAQAFVFWKDAAWAGSSARAVAFWRRTRREAEGLQVSTIHGLALGLLAQGEGAPETLADVRDPALLRLLRQTVREALALPPGHPDAAPAAELLAWAEGWTGWERLSEGHDAHRDAMGHLDGAGLEALRGNLAEALGAAETAFRPLAADPERAVDRSVTSAKRYFKPSSLIPPAPAEAPLAERMTWAARQSLVVKAKMPQYYSQAFQDAHATLGPVADAWEAWLSALLAGALRAFEARKREEGLATFGDLVRRALDGLEDGSIEPPRPRLLLVDECQDTSRSQDRFLEALKAERTVRVGDLKQAIYGFRGGDPELLRGHLAAAGDQAFRLPANFRSSREVVALANRFVETLWPDLDPECGDLDGHQEARGGPSVPVGLVQTPALDGHADLPALSDWIAALAREEGWRGTLGTATGEPAGRRRALLLANRTRLPRTLRLLKARGVQPYVIAREGFWESPGVSLAMAAFEAVAHPDRPIPAAALLRGLLGLRDPELLALAAQGERPALPGLGGLDPQAFPEARRAGVAWLKDLASATSQELAGRLLEQGALLRRLTALSAHGAMEPLRARRNLAGFLARVLTLPASPMAAFAILEEARAGAPKGDLPASPEGADLIIQTVHGSKGLEYDDVILPLLGGRPPSFHRGGLHTDPDGALALAWKVGNHPGRAYRDHKAASEARELRARLNLLYVGLTRARERLCLLLQGPYKEEGQSWAHWGESLRRLHPELRALEALPSLLPRERPAPPPLAPPAARDGGAAPGPVHEGPAPEVQARARREGEAMHTYLRDLLVRWEDDAAFQACLYAPPAVEGARERALAFLEDFEARGWRHLRRRTELPLAGAAASGAEGRADLVVWDGNTLRLLDWKNTRDFSPQDLELYRAQLARYAQALRGREGMEVEAWLVPLKGASWMRV